MNSPPSAATLADWQRLEPNVLPLGWRHRSGRKSLVPSSTARHVEGMDLRGGWALFAHLRDRLTQPRSVYSHNGTVGDMVIRDNSGTMHRALADPHDSGLLMHRTTVRGDEPPA